MSVKTPITIVIFTIDKTKDYVNSVGYCYFLNTPIRYEDAMKRSDAHEWKKAMTTKIDTLKQNDTLVTTDFPEYKTIVEEKVSFRVKRRPEKLQSLFCRQGLQSS